MAQLWLWFKELISNYDICCFRMADILLLINHME